MSTSQITQFSIPPGVIDLGLGDPQFALLPLDLMRQAAQRRLEQNDPCFLQYGAEQGDGHFRLALASFLSQGYGVPVEPDSLFVTCGASFGLDLICNLFTCPGDTIFVEEPSYFLALHIFTDHDLQIVPIQTDENGVVIESLEEKLKVNSPKFLYVIPTFQNPTGHTLSQERREQLVSLSREYNFLVVADEVYHLLSYGAKPPRPFAAYIEAGNVLSLGSFSKILAPGLRLGWIQSSPERIERLVTCGLLDSGGGLNPFTSAIVGDILETGGLEKNIAKLVATYSSRITAMDASLRRHLPEAKYTVPRGGYFFWIRLSSRVDAFELQKRALEFKVNFRPGIRFSSQGGLREYIRLSFVFYEPDEIEQGVIRLKQCLENG